MLQNPVSASWVFTSYVAKGFVVQLGLRARDPFHDCNVFFLAFGFLQRSQFIQNLQSILLILLNME